MGCFDPLTGESLGCGCCGGDPLVSSCISPDFFPELRAWWEAEDSPANGSALPWTPRAGTQPVALPVSGTSVRGVGEFPNPLTVGQRAGYLLTSNAWTFTDGITYFITTRLNAVGIAFAQANSTVSLPRQFSLLSNTGPVAQTAKQDGAPITVLNSTGLNATPISWVVSLGTSGLVRVSYKLQGGLVTLFSTTSAIPFGTPTGHSINIAQGAVAIWGQPTTRAGIIGRVLSVEEQDRLCFCNARAAGF